MAGVHLGDRAKSVREVIGMTTDYHAAWRTLNKRAQAICYEVYGDIPLNQANTLPAIERLREHYAPDKGSMDEMSWKKIREALNVQGTAAWVIHNALKRNFDKYRKGLEAQQARVASEAVDGCIVKAPGSTKEVEAGSSTSRKEMWDPVREVWVSKDSLLKQPS